MRQKSLRAATFLSLLRHQACWTPETATIVTATTATKAKIVLIEYDMSRLHHNRLAQRSKIFVKQFFQFERKKSPRCCRRSLSVGVMQAASQNYVLSCLEADCAVGVGPLRRLLNEFFHFSINHLGPCFEQFEKFRNLQSNFVKTLRINQVIPLVNN